MDPFDAAAPAGAAAPGDAPQDDDVAEGELVDAGGEPLPAGGAGRVFDIGDPDDGPDAAAAAGIPELSAMERVTAERDEYLDALRRVQADFENFRKRARRQEAERSAWALESLVERLLPVLDATDLAAEHAADEKDATAFTQVASLLWDVLAKEGLERVRDEGVPFDPNIHDAVAHVPADAGGDAARAQAKDDGSEGEDAAEDEAADGAGATGVPMVDAILRPGFLLRGKVLRPAMVRVKG